MYCIEIHQSIVFALIVVNFVAASYIKFWVSCENHVLKLIKSQQEHTSLHVSA